MRLIDKDLVLKTAKDKEWGLWCEIANIKFAPEVKAIPIEWVLNYRKNNRNQIAYYTEDALDYMLEAWCEENNIDMWGMIDNWEKENANNKTE